MLCRVIATFEIELLRSPWLIRATLNSWHVRLYNCVRQLFSTPPVLHSAAPMISWPDLTWPRFVSAPANSLAWINQLQAQLFSFTALAMILHLGLLVAACSKGKTLFFSSGAAKMLVLLESSLNCGSGVQSHKPLELYLHLCLLC